MFKYAFVMILLLAAFISCPQLSDCVVSPTNSKQSLIRSVSMRDSVHEVPLEEVNGIPWTPQIQHYCCPHSHSLKLMLFVFVKMEKIFLKHSEEKKKARNTTCNISLMNIN